MFVIYFKTLYLNINFKYKEGVFWYHEDLERLEKEITELEFNPKLIFYGSSTFTLWNELTSLFKEHKPANYHYNLSYTAC